MKTKLLGWLSGSVAVMLLLPWASVTFVSSNAGMAVTLLLFFVIDPIYAAGAGSFAGRDIKGLWSVPVIAALLFLLGAWISLIWVKVHLRYMQAFIWLLAPFPCLCLHASVQKRTDDFLLGGNDYDCIYIERSAVGMGFLYNRILPDWNRT